MYYFLVFSSSDPEDSEQQCKEFTIDYSVFRAGRTKLCLDAPGRQKLGSTGFFIFSNIEGWQLGQLQSRYLQIWSLG
jgi:hypothetical protein